ncbi:MAG TPA: YciI family protein [Actinocrinis sp.]|jgi:hypothetical protein
MTRYLLAVTFEDGPGMPPMTEWKPEEVQAHLDYYTALNQELVESGELVGGLALTGPEHACIVTGDGVSAPVRTDGPFAEAKEWIAGYQIVDVDSEQRAVEIAGLVSAVPGPGGRPTRQPVHVRRVMDVAPSDAAEMDTYVRTGE